jgi:hypothetical protein
MQPSSGVKVQYDLAHALHHFVDGSPPTARITNSLQATPGCLSNRYPTDIRFNILRLTQNTGINDYRFQTEVLTTVP